MFFSGLIGYGFGYSIFAKYQAIEAGYTRGTGLFHKILGKFSFFDVRTRSYIDTVGSLGLSLILGIILHILYNIFFFLGFSYLSFFSLIVGIVCFIWILGQDRLL